MAGYPKPWEHYSRNQDPGRFHSASELGLRPGIMRPLAPPLPPRSNTITRNRPRYGNLSNVINNSYGDYGGYYPSYPTTAMYRQQEFGNRYIQMAEESAQPAFDSIEAFIRGFSSVTMMLESTFQAMNLSFRAILGVAENMSKMRGAIIEFLSAFAILKVIHSFYRKILHFLGIVNGMEVSWKDANKTVVKGTQKHHWPILAFLGAIIIGPTLVYKYLLPKEIVDNDEVQLLGVFDFEAEQNGELSFAKGDVMTTKRSELKKNWLFVTKPNGKGYVPHNRVRRFEKQIMPEKQIEKPKPKKQEEEEPRTD